MHAAIRIPNESFHGKSLFVFHFIWNEVVAAELKVEFLPLNMLIVDESWIKYAPHFQAQGADSFDTRIHHFTGIFRNYFLVLENIFYQHYNFIPGFQ